jgi:hypothetical protein
MTHKEFYIWLEGFMTNRSWTVIQQSDIEGIQEKMKEVKDVDPFFPNPRTTVPSPFNPIIIPLKDNDSDPHKPPFKITCETKQQLND